MKNGDEKQYSVTIENSEGKLYCNYKIFVICNNYDDVNRNKHITIRIGYTVS